MFFKKNNFTRALFFLLGDSVALLLSSIAAYFILFSFDSVSLGYPFTVAIGLTLCSLIGLTIFKMYQVSWRYTSLRELMRTVFGVFSGAILFIGVGGVFIDITNFTFAYTAIFSVIGLLSVGGFRISKRMIEEVVYTPKVKNSVVVYGAGDAGDQIIRDIQKHNSWDLNIAAVFDDDTSMHGLHMHGVKILGGNRRLTSYIRFNKVEELIIAIPSLPKKTLRETIDKIKQIRPELKIKVLPSFHSLTDDPVGIRNIREISIEDILGREPAKIDIKTIRSSIKDKIVLVTGAGGSIGSEIVRQCANLHPSKLIALDVDETELFHLENELNETGFQIAPCVANITDKQKIDQIFSAEQPDVVFHAAAYKHVPMMESFPEEAIKVNIGGTRIVAEIACKYNTDKFVMISTDKAVNPANVMGATKRVAEEICMTYNKQCATKFISVRFGNVLGSRGSVVPLFMGQIKKGGPLTVTDPEMTRYFMTIPEAVLLVIQAGSMGDGGEVFVLDMGEPVKILDMARELIRLHGLEPDVDIPIEFNGLRPGEKMYEELLNAEEGVQTTCHDRINMAVCSQQLSSKELNTIIGHIFDEIELGNTSKIRYLLKQMVPTYTYTEISEKQETIA
ncbi:MAG: nucleoside-diphosphate sugar epimerase/dehydratase [Balneolaceae bacterium]